MKPVLGIPVNNPGPQPERLASAGAKLNARGGTTERRKGSNAGGAAGSRSALRYQRSGGDQPEGPRGKEAPEHGNVRGKDGGDTELHNRDLEPRSPAKHRA